jgi:hypothetical protein
MPSGPRAWAGMVTSVPAAPRQIAASMGRRRWLKAVVAAVISASLQKDLIFDAHPAPERGNRASGLAVVSARHQAA